VRNSTIRHATCLLEFIHFSRPIRSYITVSMHMTSAGAWAMSASIRCRTPMLWCPS